MATDYTAPLSASADEMDFPYRELSKLAIASFALAVVAALGLIPLFAPLLALTVVGVICGVLGMRMIGKYPNEYSGMVLAKAGLALNAMLLLGGIGTNVYIILTEVPDGYERVHFWQLEKPKGNDAPTDRAKEVDGKDIFIKGYIHPASGTGAMKRFILVPDLGTCCFGGQPRSSSMIEVNLTGTKTVSYSMTKLRLGGKFKIQPRKLHDVEIENILFYQLQADYLVE